MKARGIGTVMAFVAEPSAAAPFWRDALDAPMREDLQVVELGELSIIQGDPGTRVHMRFALSKPRVGEAAVARLPSQS